MPSIYRHSTYTTMYRQTDTNTGEERFHGTQARGHRSKKQHDCVIPWHLVPIPEICRWDGVRERIRIASFQKLTPEYSLVPTKLLYSAVPYPRLQVPLHLLLDRPAKLPSILHGGGRGRGSNSLMQLN